MVVVAVIVAILLLLLTQWDRSLDILLLAHQLMVNLEEDEKAEEILETMQNLAPDDARVMTALLA